MPPNSPDSDSLQFNIQTMLNFPWLSKKKVFPWLVYSNQNPTNTHLLDLANMPLNAKCLSIYKSFPSFVFVFVLCLLFPGELGSILEENFQPLVLADCCLIVLFNISSGLCISWKLVVISEAYSDLGSLFWHPTRTYQCPDVPLFMVLRLTRGWHIFNISVLLLIDG